jgi:DNA replication and repair protein RecF
MLASVPARAMTRQATPARVRRLSLTNFRNYRTALLEVDRGPVVLIGPNGAGKTNLLESISLLAPGRGLRRANLEDLAFAPGNGSWAVAAEVEGALGLATLGTGVERVNPESIAPRKYRVDREPAGSATAFADHLRVVWLVPTMDGLFAGPPSERRRFLDRLVLALDAEHASRVKALERALRSRNRLLEERNRDPRWLEAVEHEIAQVAVAVAAERVDAVRRLAAVLAIANPARSAFPSAEIAVEGTLELALGRYPAIEVEDRYRAALRSNRARDGLAGRTLEGPHLSDLVVTHGPKGLPAAATSTGEQKAMLINLVLAHAGLVADITGFAPVVLLDEVAAHLDPVRRAGLFDALAGLGAQVFMTGADPVVFAELGARTEIFTVAPGLVERARQKP